VAGVRAELVRRRRHQFRGIPLRVFEVAENRRADHRVAQDGEIVVEGAIDLRSDVDWKGGGSAIHRTRGRKHTRAQHTSKHPSEGDIGQELVPKLGRLLEDLVHGRTALEQQTTVRFLAQAVAATTTHRRVMRERASWRLLQRRRGAVTVAAAGRRGVGAAVGRHDWASGGGRGR